MEKENKKTLITTTFEIEIKLVFIKVSYKVTEKA